MTRLRLALESLFRRVGFCPNGEHRETCEPEFGHLIWRCIDCGRRTDLGPVFVHASNHRRHA
jgi:hypothetical protein